MKRQRKLYHTPKRPWDKERIESEREVMKSFGLKTKREIWRTASLLRKYRKLARELAARRNMDKEMIIIEKLAKLGILKKNATLDDVLGLTLEDFLNRRLETVVYKRKLANTPKQARQFIVHGKVLINDRKVRFPSYIVPVGEEEKIMVKMNVAVKQGEANGKAAE